MVVITGIGAKKMDGITDCLGVKKNNDVCTGRDSGDSRVSTATKGIRGLSADGWRTDK